MLKYHKHLKLKLHEGLKVENYDFIEMAGIAMAWEAGENHITHHMSPISSKGLEIFSILCYQHSAVLVAEQLRIEVSLYFNTRYLS